MRMCLRMGSLLASVCLRLPAGEWTEQELIRRFLEQNPVIRETRARHAMAQAETRGRTLWMNPVATVSREGAGHTEFYQVSQALPLSGRLPLLREAGSAQLDVVEAEGAFSLWTARCALRAAFYRALASEMRQKLWTEAEAELVRTIAILAEREAAGEGSRLDRLRAERERAELQASARMSEAGREQHRFEVLAFLPAGLPDAFAGTLETSVPPEPLASFVAKALESRADLQAERRRLEQMRRAQLAAERLRLPEPVLTAGLKRADVGLPGLSAGPVVGVSWALPVFNKGRTEVARYSAEQEQVSARLEQMSRRLRAAIEGAWRVFAVRRDARDRYRSAQASDDLVHVTAVAYQEGEIGILQLLDAYRVRHESRLRQIDLALLAKEAQIALEAQIGEEFAQ